jgi:hypothetical protein
VKRGEEYFSGGYALWTVIDWWSRIFYLRAAGQSIPDASTTEALNQQGFRA